MVRRSKDKLRKGAKPVGSALGTSQERLLAKVLKPEGNLDAAIKQFQALNLDALQLTPFERDLLKDAREHL